MANLTLQVFHHFMIHFELVIQPFRPWSYQYMAEVKYYLLQNLGFRSICPTTKLHLQMSCTNGAKFEEERRLQFVHSMHSFWKNGPFSAPFSFFVFLIQLTDNVTICRIFLMNGFEPRTSLPTERQPLLSFLLVDFCNYTGWEQSGMVLFIPTSNHFDRV